MNRAMPTAIAAILMLLAVAIPVASAQTKVGLLNDAVPAIQKAFPGLKIDSSKMPKDTKISIMPKDIQIGEVTMPKDLLGTAKNMEIYQRDRATKIKIDGVEFGSGTIGPAGEGGKPEIVDGKNALSYKSPSLSKDTAGKDPLKVVPSGGMKVEGDGGIYKITNEGKTPGKVKLPGHGKYSDVPPGGSIIYDPAADRVRINAPDGYSGRFEGKAGHTIWHTGSMSCEYDSKNPNSLELTSPRGNEIRVDYPGGPTYRVTKDSVGALKESIKGSGSGGDPFSIRYLWEESKTKATGLEEVSLIGKKFDFANTLQTQGRLSATLERGTLYARGEPLSFLRWEIMDMKNPELMEVLTPQEQKEYTATFEGYWFKTAKSRYELLLKAINRRKATLSK